MTKAFRTGRIPALLLAVVLLVTACTSQPDSHQVAWTELQGESVSYADGYQVVAEAEGLRLLVEESSGSVAVDTGAAVWYSNPPSPENDPYAAGTVQDRMRSQFMLYYYDGNSELKTVNSYSDCVKNQQYHIEYTDNGVKIVYTLGSFKRGVESIPQQLSDERYQVLFAANEALSEKDRRFVEKCYRQEDGVWVFRSTDSSLIINQMLDILDAIGYDEEQLQADNEAAGLEVAVADHTAFRVAVYYTLENGGLRVTVPMDEFRYAGDVEPVRLDLLEFFGAAENTEDGYLFVPDGCGALIDLKTAVSSDVYEAAVYGTQSGQDNTQTVHLPVYGLKNGPSAFIAMIEEGDALAAIHAYQSGITCARGGVYSSFTLKESGYVTLGGQEEETEILSFQRQLYEGDLSVLFCFLQDGQADYVGMAQIYRQRLLERGVLTGRVTDDDYALTVRTIGAVERAQSLLMIRYEGWEALTTFEQIGMLAERLRQSDVNAVRFQMSSWLTGGLAQARADRAKPLSVLGGSGGLKKLLKTTAGDTGVRIEGLVDFGRFRSDNLFTQYSDAARTVDQALTRLLQRDPVTQTTDPEADNNTYILTPSKLTSAAAGFAKKTFGDGFSVAVNDLADVLYGDYERTHTVDRQTAAGYAEEALAVLAGDGKLSVSGGNAYALAYADTVNDIPLSSSGFSLLDEDVPFYSLALHGYVQLYAEPLNYQADREAALLESVAAGAGLSCCWMAADSSILKDTEYSEYYSACYADTYEDITASYTWARDLVGDLQGQTITDHRILQTGVTVTVYENGVHLYVNRTDETVTVSGVTIPAKDARRTDGKEAA